ncbi:hypothetical protein CORC01_09801 [Colletotrichum orchidophilum]|uniref:Enoyl reductase (ER) domain-containing protein n=1 Tax=Colletotrichum orchidophilum TaxID=1209926 RepID=A0A1G4B0Q4_9PEZI|nr:uncharacterized protein CORC01_09801 [Colletotrichum orchidophilum]OHE94882.1 hypothetical protein CORC01_09801 [Colletotrichum orchidophilum]
MATSIHLPATMRAAQWRSVGGGIERNMKINTEAQLPKGAKNLPKSCTLVRVAYASLNHLDYKIAEMPLVSSFISKPATPGLDFSGTVIASTLATLRPGQRVFGRNEPSMGGTLAEYVVVGKANIAVLPEGVSLRDAACVGICGVTALQSLAPFVRQGSSVLINGGSGGVGVFAIEVAKALGCTQITAICSARNADLCRRLGADSIIDYTSGDLVKDLKESGQQYDHILDTVFETPDLYWQCHHYLVAEGTGGQRTFRFHSVTSNTADFLRIASLVADGSVEIVVDEEFNLADVCKAYGKLKSGRTVGKLVVRVS